MGEREGNDRGEGEGEGERERKRERSRKSKGTNIKGAREGNKRKSERT